MWLDDEGDEDDTEQSAVAADLDREIRRKLFSILHDGLLPNLPADADRRDPKVFAYIAVDCLMNQSEQVIALLQAYRDS
ncbi:hypothetical protein [Dankookia sp. P2]|uniref:hypothetical protein n=1 Tax=Dankookia sp. P2 TaxID=3423955 RepID=UPI003D67DCF3